MKYYKRAWTTKGADNEMIMLEHPDGEWCKRKDAEREIITALSDRAKLAVELGERIAVLTEENRRLRERIGELEASK